MKRSCARVSIGRVRGFVISITVIVISGAAIVPAIITATTSALKRRDAGVTSKSSAIRTYGGLQSDTQATANMECAGRAGAAAARPAARSGVDGAAHRGPGSADRPNG